MDINYYKDKSSRDVDLIFKGGKQQMKTFNILRRKAAEVNS